MNLRAIVFLIILPFIATPAEARHHKRHHHHTAMHTATVAQGCQYSNDGRVTCYQGQNNALQATPMGRKIGTQPVNGYDMAEGIVSHPAGCPGRQFCGCGTSVRIFGHPVRDLFLAANWRRFPPASPGPGMVAYRSGHVFAIERVNGDGTVVAYDPNSGRHLTRIHTVSLRGYHVVDPNGNRARHASL